MRTAQERCIPMQPIRAGTECSLQFELVMTGKAPTEAALELLRKKFDALLEETAALRHRITAALISETGHPFRIERRRVSIPHVPERRRH